MWFVVDRDRDRDRDRLFMVLDFLDVIKLVESSLWYLLILLIELYEVYGRRLDERRIREIIN